MIIQVDKEAEKLLTELVDGYLKLTGVNGMKNVTILQRSLRPIPEHPVEKNVPDGKPVEELAKPVIADLKQVKE